MSGSERQTDESHEAGKTPSSGDQDKSDAGAPEQVSGSGPGLKGEATEAVERATAALGKDE